MGVYRVIGVPKIPQKHDMSCWYAAARMVMGTYVKGPLLGMGAGKASESEQLFQEGLSNGRYREFLRQNNMADLADHEDELMRIAGSHSKGCPGIPFDQMITVLNKYGPLWTVIRQGKHAVTLVGGQTDKDGTEFILYHDPASGTEKAMKYDDFLKTVQWEAKGIVGFCNMKTLPDGVPVAWSISSGVYATASLPQ